MANKRFAVILAAGEGTRMKSRISKVLHPVCGVPMIGHVTKQAMHLSMDRVICVTAPHAQDICAQLGKGVDYTPQQEQLGTAHAVSQAGGLLAEEAGTTLVLYGDTPLITAATMKALMAHHETEGAAATMLTSVADDATGYGRIIRSEDGELVGVVEDKDATPEQKSIKEINTGIICFDNQALFAALRQVDNDNAQGEYYLPDVLSVLRGDGAKVTTYQTDDFEQTLGVNDRVQLAKAEVLMKKRINEGHMRNGVTITDPDAVYIASKVNIGPDTIIEPGTHLRGNTQIGAGCTIGPHSQITDSTIGNETSVNQSIISDSLVGKGVTIGPFAHIRPASDIGDQARIGNFVETKKARIGEGTKASHLSYIGDADIGAGVNFSCGAITVNYDGANKHATVIGDGAMIGCNVNLVAPVNVGEHAFLAAGSTITDEVPGDALSIARSRQTNKKDYMRK